MTALPQTITFRKVTMPIVRPIFVLMTVLSVIWDANVFNQVWYLTQGNAQLLNVVPLGVWQYIEAFSSTQYGLGRRGRGHNDPAPGGRHGLLHPAHGPHGPGKSRGEDMTAPVHMAGTRTARYRYMTWVWRAVAIAFAAIMVFPVYWMVQSAFEPNSDITSLSPNFFPVHFTFHNFVDAVHHTAGVGTAYFLDDARNSLLVVGSATAITLVFGFLAAAAVSRFRLRGASGFLVLILVVQMVPGTALIIPLFLCWTVSI